MANKTKIYALISWGIVFLAMVFLGSKTTYQSDDYSYHFFYTSRDSYDAVPFNNFFVEIIPSMINHWYTCNGRFFAHTIVQLIMQGPHIVFVVLNALVFVSVIYLVMKLAKMKMTAGRILLVSALAFLLTPIFGQTSLWVSGSINYLWMGFFQLSFALLFLTWMKSSDKIKWHYIVLIVMSVFIGNSQMHGGPAVFIALSVWAILKYHGDLRLLGKIAVLDVLGVIGFGLNYFSVGSSQRLSDTTDGIMTTTHLMAYVDYTKSIWPLIGLLLVVVIIGMKQIGVKQWILNQKNNPVMFVMVIATLTAKAVMFFTSDLVTRTLYPMYLFLLVVLVSVVADLRKTALTSGVFVTVSLAALTMFWAATLNLEATHQVDVYNIQKLEHASKEDDVDLKFNYVCPLYSKMLAGVGYLYNPMTGVYRFSNEADGWVNQWAANYYGVKSVRVDLNLK